jgi:hypothetical protein
VGLNAWEGKAMQIIPLLTIVGTFSNQQTVGLNDTLSFIDFNIFNWERKLAVTKKIIKG